MFREIRQLEVTPARPLLVALILFLVCGALWAQAFGRVVLKISDEDGKPLKGVQVTVTAEGISTFKIEKESDKKGKVTLSFVDATQVYDVRLEYGDYPPFDFDLKATLGTTTEREIALRKSASAVASDAGPPPAASLTAAEKLYNEGVTAMQAKDVDTAMERFLAAAEKDPKLAAAHSALASLYLEKGMAAEALAAADRLIELAPANPRGFRVRYEALTDLGRTDEAKKALDALKTLDAGSDTAAMIFNDAISALRQGNNTYAAARLQEALEMDPDLVPALAVLGTIYISEKRYQDALDAADKAVAMKADDSRALRVRWEALRGLGETDKANEALQALAAVDPDVLANELYNEGASLFEDGQTEQAQARFEEVLAINADHALAHYRLGICHVGSGNTAKAREHLEKFLELAPDHPEAAVAQEMLAYLN